MHYSHAQTKNKGRPPYFDDWTNMQFYIDGVMLKNLADFQSCTEIELEEE